VQDPRVTRLNSACIQKVAPLEIIGGPLGAPAREARSRDPGAGRSSSCAWTPRHAGARTCSERAALRRRVRPQLDARREGPTVVVEVADRGPGPAPGDGSASTFYPARGPALCARRSAGSGLFAICRASWPRGRHRSRKRPGGTVARIRAVERSRRGCRRRGRIAAGHDHCHGARVTETPPIPQPPAPDPPSHPALALVVEDEEPMRRFLRAALESAGYRVQMAETAKDGLREATSRSPDVIVLDLGLPDPMDWRSRRLARRSAVPARSSIDVSLTPGPTTTSPSPLLSASRWRGCGWRCATPHAAAKPWGDHGRRSHARPERRRVTVRGAEVAHAPGVCSRPGALRRVCLDARSPARGGARRTPRAPICVSTWLACHKLERDPSARRFTGRASAAACEALNPQPPSRAEGSSSKRLLRTETSGTFLHIAPRRRLAAVGSSNRSAVMPPDEARRHRCGVEVNRS
jgi:hypothetical protein